MDYISTQVYHFFLAISLSGSSGIRAGLPPLLLGIAASLSPEINLGDDMKWVAGPICISLSAVLVALETVLDKIPALDNILDLVTPPLHTVVGAVVAVAPDYGGSWYEKSPMLVFGALLALAIKLAKALTRECCTASTCGMGNWLQSLLEDVFSFVLIVLALAVLMASIVIGLGFLLVAFWFVVKRCKKCCEEKGGDSGEETPLVQGESAKEPLMPGEEDQEAAKKGWWEDDKKPKEGEGGNWWEDPNAPKGDGDGGAKPVNTV